MLPAINVLTLNNKFADTILEEAVNTIKEIKFKTILVG